MIRRRLSLSAIAGEATAFRWQHCPLVTGAVALEEIMEFDLKIEIVPEPNLMIKTGGKLGALSADGREIRVDAAFQLGNPRDYRSFLAHELGHWNLHLHLVPGGRFPDRAAFVRFHELLDSVLGSQLEYEAVHFGLCLLMPRIEAESVFRQALDVVRDRFRDVNSGAARMFAAQLVANHFSVSEMRAEYRINELNLWREVRREERRRMMAKAAPDRLTG